MNKPVFQKILLALIFLGLLAPFLSKAVHIDDPLYILTSEQILKSPIDFYGFNVNWYGYEMPMSQVMKNPPLSSYYLALTGKYFGWRATTLHLAMLLPAVFLAFDIYNLAAPLCARPFWASLTAITTPVLLLSSTTLMCDVLMLTFWVWAVVFWRRGLKEDSHPLLALAAGLIAASILTKYYGASLIPLLFCYSWAERRKLEWPLLYLLIPVATLTGFQWVTYWLYGKGLFGDAAEYALQRSLSHILMKSFVGLSFLGGCLLTTLFLAPFLWPRRYLLPGLLLPIIIGFALYLVKVFGVLNLVGADGAKWETIFQAGLFITVGLQLLAIAVLDLLKANNTDSLILFLWVLGTFLFAAVVNWSENGRSILPLVPAAAILLMRQIERGGWLAWPQREWKMLAVFLPAAFLALVVSWSDYQLANSVRATTGEISHKFQQLQGRVWFEGHWGFQYYMQKNGFTPLDVKDKKIAAGDLVVLPPNNTNVYPLDPKSFTLVDKLTRQACSWLAVTNSRVGAGFYSDIFGPLPFVFGTMPEETYTIYKCNQ
jgi:4-amino-4-deoxy-L-arabinose transferase-like glycosyltransferase